jgi:hypothetical protein
VIQYGHITIQRDGRVWLTAERTLLGTVGREKREWRSKCDRCSPWWSPIERTRRTAAIDLIDHWNEHREQETR